MQRGSGYGGISDHAALYDIVSYFVKCIFNKTDFKNGDAGHVVETFGEFVGGGNLIIGVIIFVIIIIIQFIVINKGTERVSEVTARFTLDAMAGKQMAIDSDLNTGAITDKEAALRRKKLQQENSFFGSMDGATKFVKVMQRQV